MIRVLQLPDSIEKRNGRMSVIMNVYRKIDRSKIQFDFACTDYGNLDYSEEIEKLGGKIFYIDKSKASLGNIKKLLTKVMSVNQYDYLHYHALSKWGYGITIAHKFNIKTIVESHATKLSDNLIKSFRNRIFSLNIINCSDYRIAVSYEAGKKLFMKQSFKVIPNMLNYNKYNYNEKKRKYYREKLKIKGQDVLIGCVGRIAKQKNQYYALKVLKKMPDNFKIAFIGGSNVGEKTLTKLKKIVNKYNLKNRVIFYGEVNNVYDYYSAFDAFWLPSLYEGLPTVVLEAFANGLPCIISNKITSELKISKFINYLPINRRSEKKWRNITSSLCCKRNSQSFFELEKSEFNIGSVMKKWDELYGI